MAASLFELETDPSKVLIKSFEVSNKDLLKPSNANPLEIGELVVLSTGLKLVRCADHSTAEAGPYFLFDEKGRTETQAVGKVAVIAGGPFFGKTKIFTGSPAIGAELDAGNVTVTINGTSFTKSGLLAHTTGKVVAISLGVDAKGYLMFQGVL